MSRKLQFFSSIDLVGWCLLASSELLRVVDCSCVLSSSFLFRLRGSI
ncbi:MAG: hypothetical protein H6544_01330 [Prevotellaceae bacterium]|nr:hypothetical protein [Prevotellaceae bacterium]